MAILNSNALTLGDWTKRLDPNGSTAAVVELLSQVNDIDMDCLHKMGNLPTGDRTTVRTGLPAVYWRALNQGIPNSKSTTAQVDEGCGMLEAYSETDVDLLKLNDNQDSFLLSEAKPFLEAMSQERASTLFYGNPASDPKKFLGFGPRYSSTSGSVANSQNVLSANGSGGASVFLVGWGENSVYCPFPKGSEVGISYEDLGVDTVYTATAIGAATASATERMRARILHWQWKTGLVVRDWRYVVRIPNISISDLLAGSGTQATTSQYALYKLMMRALYRIPNPRGVRLAFYMNRTVHSGLSLQAASAAQNVLKVEDGISQFGRPSAYTTFLGVPIRQCDALINTEAAV